MVVVVVEVVVVVVVVVGDVVVDTGPQPDGTSTESVPDTGPNASRTVPVHIPRRCCSRGGYSHRYAHRLIVTSFGFVHDASNVFVLPRRLNDNPDGFAGTPAAVVVDVVVVVVVVVVVAAATVNARPVRRRPRAGRVHRPHLHPPHTRSQTPRPPNRVRRRRRPRTPNRIPTTVRPARRPPLILPTRNRRITRIAPRHPQPIRRPNPLQPHTRRLRRHRHRRRRSRRSSSAGRRRC